jgi:hypothetical protein
MGVIAYGVVVAAVAVVAPESGVVELAGAVVAVVFVVVAGVVITCRMEFKSWCDPICCSRSLNCANCVTNSVPLTGCVGS